MAKLPECDDILSGIADFPLCKFILEWLHYGGGIAHRVDKDNTKASETIQWKSLKYNIKNDSWENCWLFQFLAL